LQDPDDNQVADSYAQRRPHERVDAAAMAARSNVAADGAQVGRPFDDDLPEEEDEHPQHVEPVRQEGAIAGVGLLLRLDAADGQDLVVGLA